MAAISAQPEERTSSNRAAGLVFNIAHFSVQDGPGIRTTVFLKGCPLHCWWCHNPESQSHRPEVVYVRERCRRCGDCVRACPQHALRLEEDVRVDDTLCQRCGTCADSCLADAREIAGKRMSVDEIVATVERDRVFYEESGGGVTLSGGEPLQQRVFTEELLRNFRARRIHTALDTCGYAPLNSFQRIAEHVDLFLFDLKVVDELRHRQLTGVSNDLILKNLTWLASRSKEVVIRVPVVPDCTDSDKNFSEIASLARSLSLRRIDLLPYHRTARDKYDRLQRDYRLGAVAPPSSERMHDIAEHLTREGCEVRIGG